jgi:ABC-type transport system involved in cytochrome bd biosynthesis fused ATPase/permease subunit
VAVATPHPPAAASAPDRVLEGLSGAQREAVLHGEEPLLIMQDKTVIAIAHRLSTLRAMDRIVVLEDGQIVEDRSHQDLVARGGAYASLWNSQVSGFIPD